MLRMVMRKILFLLLIISSNVYCSDSNFSAWMTNDDLSNYLDIIKESQYKSTPYIIHAVQGRSFKDKDQYRVIVTNKKSYIKSWWWWRGQDLEAFTQKMKDYEIKGAHLFYAQSFTNSSGKILYQGVWIIYKK